MDDWKEQYSDDPEVVIGWIKAVYLMSDGDWCDCVRRVAAARDKEITRLRAELAECAEVLPGPYYMDLPDGGDVSVSEQLKRMAKDAERYRLLRRKFAIISDGEGHAEFCAINLPRPTYIAPSSAIELDTALDRERLGLDGARPPTPTGWSDTDWIKHLQEQEGQHPLEGLHINQGSLDAAADAYEAEYNEAQEARRVEKLRKLGARLAELLDEDQFAECEALLLAAGVMPEEKDNVAKA